MNAKGLEKKSNFELLEYFFLKFQYNCGHNFGGQQSQLFYTCFSFLNQGKMWVWTFSSLNS